jgi:hypothetical protein
LTAQAPSVIPPSFLPLYFFVIFIYFFLLLLAFQPLWHRYFILFEGFLFLVRFLREERFDRATRKKLRFFVEGSFFRKRPYKKAVALLKNFVCSVKGKNRDKTFKKVKYKISHNIVGRNGIRTHKEYNSVQLATEYTSP